MDALIPSPRIFGRTWTAEQLTALGDAYEAVLDYEEHGNARLRLVNYARLVDYEAIQAIIVSVFGSIAGRYWTASGLRLAQLALSFPHLITELQRELLLSPLLAAEALDTPSTTGAIAA